MFQSRHLYPSKSFAFIQQPARKNKNIQIPSVFDVTERQYDSNSKALNCRFA
jgi:hypothetical protein